MGSLKNTQALKQMLDGTHKSQTKITIQVPEKEPEIIHRQVGEKWIDDEGMEWEQKEGFKIKLGKLNDTREELKKFTNCFEVENGKECTKNTFTAIPQDWAMNSKTGRCLDCQIAYEHKLKMSGEYERYEKQKIYDNAMAWLKEAEKDKDIVKEAFRQIGYVNPDGDVEKWDDGKTFEMRCQEIDDEFEKFKTGYILELEKQLGIVTE